MSKMKYGLLGTASIAERATLAGMRASRDSEFYAVAGRNKEKVDRFVKEYGIQKGYYSYDELLDDKDIEAVYIPLPNSMHCEWAIKAMRKGKHVLCEKPLACTEKEVLEMFSVAKECGVKLMEAFAYVHSEYIQSIKELIDSGKLGKPIMIQSSFFTRSYTLANIRMRRDLFGGAMYDLGCYPTSLIMTLFGCEEPVDVKASAHFKDGIDDINVAYLYYKDNKKAVINCGLCSPDKYSNFIIGCENGKIESSELYNVDGKAKYTVTTESGVEVIEIETSDNYKLEIDRFTSHIRTGQELIVTEEFSLVNARILDRILDSCGYNDL